MDDDLTVCEALAVFRDGIDEAGDEADPDRREALLNADVCIEYRHELWPLGGLRDFFALLGLVEEARALLEDGPALDDELTGLRQALARLDA